MTERLRELCDDFDRYEELPDDFAKEMQRCVIVEMEVELQRLRAHCEIPKPRRFLDSLRRSR